jgi:hypothetical protein
VREGDGLAELMKGLHPLRNRVLLEQLLIATLEALDQLFEAHPLYATHHKDHFTLESPELIDGYDAWVLELSRDLSLL